MPTPIHRLNDIDRFHLVMDISERVHDRDVGENLPKIRGWEWES